MRTDEADIDDAEPRVDADNQPILIALDIEYNAVTCDNAGAGIKRS